MRKFLFLLSALALSFFMFFFFPPQTSSDELDNITKQISDLTNALNMSINATKPLESELKSLQSQIEGIKTEVASIEQDLAAKKAEIDDGYIDLAKQEELLFATVRDFYIKSYYNSPFLIFFSSNSYSEVTQTLAYKKAATDQDKMIIANIAISIAGLEEKKKNLENEQKRLTAIKADLDEQSKKLDEVVQGAKAYQADLSSQIAELTAKQQEILSQRLGSLNLPTSLGAGPLYCTDDRKVDPGFSPAFAFYTYGIPHRVGMNQYGALGRASAGQSYDQILRAYYNFDGYEDRGGMTIRVNNGNQVNEGSVIWEGNLEEYVKRIYEVPASWPMESLKAQAIAARSYALSVTNNGSNSICATQYCQVFKTEPKGGAWDQAVNETAGRVMMSGGQPIKAWYASTAGGYLFNSGDVWGESTGWTKRMRDTTSDVGSFEDLKNNAYDKESPCFYAAQGWRDEYAKSAWLKSSEVADIANVILLARADSSTGDHLYQTDKPHPYGGDIWNEDRVKSELRSRNITPYNNVSDLSVSVDFGGGVVNSISVSGNAGSQSFDGSEFKNWFNLRAPANIQIVGPLYNVEKK